MSSPELKSPNLSEQSAPEATNSPRDAKTHIPRSLVSNWAGLGANVVVGLLLTPFVVHRLGNTAYGIWALVLQLTGYMGIFDVGVSSALVRFVARFHATGDRKSLSGLLSLIQAFYECLAFACMALASIIALFVLPHMHIARPLLPDSRIVLMLAAATMAAAFLFGRNEAVLGGLSRWDLVNGVGIGVLLLRTVLIVGFLLRGHGLVSLAGIQFLTSTVGYGACAILARRFLPGIEVSWRRINRQMVPEVFRHSAFSFLISVGGRIQYEIDSIVIAAFLPIESVTFYVIGLRLVAYLRDFVNASAQIIPPIVSSMDAQARDSDVETVAVNGTKYLLLIIYPLITCLIMLGPDFIKVWMGRQYGASGTVLIILVLGEIVASAGYVAAHSLTGVTKHGIVASCTAWGAAVNFAASILLVRRYGIYGVAGGTTIALLLVGTYYVPKFVRVLKVRGSDFLRRGVIPSISPTLSLALGIVLFRRMFLTDNYLRLLLAGLAGLALYAPCAWIFALTEQERLRLVALAPWTTWKRGETPQEERVHS